MDPEYIVVNASWLAGKEGEMAVISTGANDSDREPVGCGAGCGSEWAHCVALWVTLTPPFYSGAMPICGVPGTG
jgi:hypothetical protein